MKKNAFLVLFILLMITRGYAQNYGYPSGYGGGYGNGLYKLKIGFKFSPTITLNEVDASKEFRDFDASGINLKMSLGPVIDFYFAEKYAFSTGLWYSVKGVSYAVGSSFYDNDLFGTYPLTADEHTGNKAAYNLQYLQVPVTLKIFSDGVFSDTPVYLQFGGTFDLKIAEKPIDRTSNPLYQYSQRVMNQPDVFSLGDINLLLGFGIEKRINGGDDSFIFGIQYQRGLTEINHTKGYSNLITKNGLISLDLGLKF